MVFTECYAIFTNQDSKKVVKSNLSTWSCKPFGSLLVCGEQRAGVKIFDKSEDSPIVPRHEQHAPKNSFTYTQEI